MQLALQSKPSETRARAARFAVAILAIVASSLVAQESTTRQAGHSAIIGRITDEHHTAVAGVEVVLRELPASATTTNDSGRFVIADLAAGSYHLVVRRVGYEPRSFVANLIADDTLLVGNVQLVAAAGTTRLPAVEVRDRGNDNHDLIDFEQRRRSGGAGKFITPDDMAKVLGSPLSNVLRARMPELKRISYPICAGNGIAIAGSGSASISAPQPQLTPRCKMPAECYSQIWFDGVLVYAYGTGGLPPNVDAYQTSQIEAIEIYARGGDTPTQFNSTGSACGTILIWSKR